MCEVLMSHKIYIYIYIYCYIFSETTPNHDQTQQNQERPNKRANLGQWVVLKLLGKASLSYANQQ